MGGIGRWVYMPLQLFIFYVKNKLAGWGFFSRSWKVTRLRNRDAWRRKRIFSFIDYPFLAMGDQCGNSQFIMYQKGMLYCWNLEEFVYLFSLEIWIYCSSLLIGNENLLLWSNSLGDSSPNRPNSQILIAIAIHNVNYNDNWNQITMWIHDTSIHWILIFFFK